MLFFEPRGFTAIQPIILPDLSAEQDMDIIR